MQVVEGKKKAGLERALNNALPCLLVSLQNHCTEPGDIRNSQVKFCTRGISLQFSKRQTQNKLHLQCRFQISRIQKICVQFKKHITASWLAWNLSRSQETTRPSKIHYFSPILSPWKWSYIGCLFRTAVFKEMQDMWHKLRKALQGVFICACSWVPKKTNLECSLPDHVRVLFCFLFCFCFVPNNEKKNAEK